MRPEFQKPLFILQIHAEMLGLATPMQETESGQNQRRAFNKAVGPGKKNPKLINVGLMFIPDYRVPKYVSYINSLLRNS